MCHTPRRGLSDLRPEGSYDARIVLTVAALRQDRPPWKATARRVLLPLAVVFAVLATAGWMARGDTPPPSAYTREHDAWSRDTLHGAPLPGPDRPAAEISAFFAGLTDAEADTLALTYPLVVGNLAGAPLTLRYEANRVALADAAEAERERIAIGGFSPAGAHEAKRRLNRFETLASPDRQILAFDPSGRGKVAEVLGDLESADRVALIVPGVDSDLLGFQKTFGKYTAPVGMAQALYREERDLEPDLNTAVIAWADYDAPTGIAMSAFTGDRAEAGADRLLTALTGLPGEAPVALLCHSYGSVVCGLAADRLPARVTDIAVAGSPGMRAPDVTALGTGARVWAMVAEDDWISSVPHLEVGPLGHGADPAEPEFGARLLSAGDAEGHGGYFEPGAESLVNLALVATGAVDDVRCAPGVSYCAPSDPCAVLT